MLVFHFDLLSFLVWQLKEASNRKKANHLMEEKKKRKQEEKTKTDIAQKKVNVQHMYQRASIQCLSLLKGSCSRSIW